MRSLARIEAYASAAPVTQRVVILSTRVVNGVFYQEPTLRKGAALQLFHDKFILNRFIYTIYLDFLP